MTKERPSGKPFLLIALIILLGLILWIFLFPPVEGWKILRQESKRILGWEKGETAEERRIREEVIYKKMEEALIKLGALYMEQKKMVEAKQVYRKLQEKTKREDRRELAKKMIDQIQKGMPRQ